MSRSRINGNFIDKTFSIVANILLGIIPTTSGEKKAFTYYRDGAIWFFFLIFFSLYVVKSCNKNVLRDRKNLVMKRNLRLVKVKFVGVEQSIPSVVYPRLMQSQMLQSLILALSERLDLYFVESLLNTILSIGKKHYT